MLQALSSHDSPVAGLRAAHGPLDAGGSRSSNASAAQLDDALASAFAQVRGEGADTDSKDSTFLSSVLSTAWKTIANIVKEKIQESLVASMRNEVRGQIQNIKLSSVDMGSRAPRIENLRVLQTRSPHELQVTFKLRWVSSGEAGVVITGNVKPLPVTSRIRLHNFDVEVPCWLRLRFNPSPFAPAPVTSVAFAATCRPTLSFDISIDNRRITGIFGLKELLEEAIHLALKAHLVLPNKVENRMAPDVPFAERPEAVGKVRRTGDVTQPTGHCY